MLVFRCPSKLELFMRSYLHVLSALAFLGTAAAAVAQQPQPQQPPEAPQPTQPPPHRMRGQITREEYIQHAAEIAAQRFDQIDTQHAGVLSAHQIHAWIVEHRGQHHRPPRAPQQN
jgi:hypothetical protein